MRTVGAGSALLRDRDLSEVMMEMALMEMLYPRPSLLFLPPPPVIQPAIVVVVQYGNDDGLR